MADFMSLGLKATLRDLDAKQTKKALLASEERVRVLSEALDKACEGGPCSPQVGRSIDYANGYRRGAQAQRMVARAARQALGDNPTTNQLPIDTNLVVDDTEKP